MHVTVCGRCNGRQQPHPIEVADAHWPASVSVSDARRKPRLLLGIGCNMYYLTECLTTLGAFYSSSLEIIVVSVLTSGFAVLNYLYIYIIIFERHYKSRQLYLFVKSQLKLLLTVSISFELLSTGIFSIINVKCCQQS